MPTILQIPPQAVVQSQFARDFPGILQIHRPGPFSDLWIADGMYRRGVGGTEQEARIGKSNSSPTDAGRIQVGLSRLGGAKGRTTRPDQVSEGPDILVPFATGLVGMVAPDERGTAGSSRLIIPIVDTVGPSNAGPVGRAESALG